MGRNKGPDSTTTRIEDVLIPIIRKYSDGSISDGIWAMDALIKNSGVKPYVMTLEELKAGIRGVVNIEGVKLNQHEAERWLRVLAGILAEIEKIKQKFEKMEVK